MSVGSDGSDSKSQRAYEHLQHRIENGAYGPGHRLVLEPRRDPTAAKPARKRGEARKPNGGADEPRPSPPAEPAAQPQPGA